MFGEKWIHRPLEPIFVIKWMSTKFLAQNSNFEGNDCSALWRPNKYWKKITCCQLRNAHRLQKYHCILWYFFNSFSPVQANCVELMLVVWLHEYIYCWFFFIFAFSIVLRDIEERGRDLENVLFQYTNLVKPAFEEFCLPVSIMHTLLNQVKM